MSFRSMKRLSMASSFLVSCGAFVGLASTSLRSDFDRRRAVRLLDGAGAGARRVAVGAGGGGELGHAAAAFLSQDLDVLDGDVVQVDEKIVLGLHGSFLSFV